MDVDKGHTFSLTYHLLSFSLWGDEPEDMRPYKRPLDGFPLRIDSTSSILTKASSSAFMMYLAGTIFVCIIHYDDSDDIFNNKHATPGFQILKYKSKTEYDSKLTNNQKPLILGMAPFLHRSC